MEDEEIKLTKKQICEIQGIQRAEQAINAALQGAMSAAEMRHMQLNEQKRAWWSKVLKTEVFAAGWIFDVERGIVRKC